jgi:hypothetical protein
MTGKKRTGLLERSPVHLGAKKPQLEIAVNRTLLGGIAVTILGD